MAEKRDILWRFLGDAKSLDRASKDAGKSLGGVQKGMGNLTKAAGALGLAFGAREIGQFALDARELARSADEAASKFEAVFGPSQDAAAAVENFADKAGVAQFRSEDLFATLGNLLSSQGFGSDAALSFTEDIGTLAGGLASFNDADPEQVFEDLAFAMTTTERDALKKYGIAISENEVKQRALILASEDGRTEISKADKALATYQIAVEQAGGAVGDLDRTIDSAANRTRRLNARMTDLKVQIGRALEPLEELFLDVAESLVILADAEGEASEKGIALGRTIGDIGSAISGLPGIDKALSEPLSRALDNMERIPAIGTFIGKMREVNDALTDAGGGTDELSTAQARWADQQVMDNLAGQAGRLRDAVGDVGEEVEEQLEPWEEWARAIGITDQKMQDIIGTVEGASGKGFGTIGQGAGAPVVRRPSRFARERFGEGPSRQSGGIVPGPRGQPRMIMAHGGERISGMGSRSGDGGGVTINFNGVVGDPDAVAAQISDLLTRYEQTNGVPLRGLSEF